MKKILRTAAALVLAGCMMTANVFAATTFTDVPSSFWGQSFIYQAAEAGLVSGMGDGTYGVNKKLSAAQFTTMVCNLICKEDVADYYNTYKPADWWYSYMAVAYSKGYLKNTTVGDARLTNNAWSASSVNGEISRYDMAQIMVNVAKSEGWELPDNVDILAAQLKIGDWNKIPGKYQMAVATAYAKSYLSGMDAAGTFAGDQTMTRTHGAVVICKLISEHENAQAPSEELPEEIPEEIPEEKTVTEADVKDLMDDFLYYEYGLGDTWDMEKSYTSEVFTDSSVTGNRAFAYYFSDYLFEDLPVLAYNGDEVKIADIRPGDVVMIEGGDNGDMYLVVTDVDADGDEFGYVYVNSNGKFRGGSMKADDLAAEDTLYTRYPK